MPVNRKWAVAACALIVCVVGLAAAYIEVLPAIISLP